MTLQKDTIAALRFGLGFRPDQRGERDPDAMVAGLRAVAAARPIVDAAEDERLWTELQEFREAKKADRKNKSDERAAMIKDERRDFYRRLTRVWDASLARSVEAEHAFAERMARFWANHFSVSIKFPAHASRVAGFEDQAIRPHLAGRFSDMLQAATMHPAMLVFLDQNRSAGPSTKAAKREGLGLNENLGREILELHTLGVSAPYSQQDVIALAMLLTGFTMRGRQGSFVYRDEWAEPGRFELMGESFRGGSQQETLRALEMLATHPATARHIATKLAAHFVADEPPARLVEALEADFRRTGGDLASLSRTLLTHPDAWGPLGGKVRQPQEIVVAALRAAGVTAKTLEGRNDPFKGLTLQALKDMGQQVNRAPGPDGWPEASAEWINPGALAIRLEWAARMGEALAARQLDPREYAETALRDALDPQTAWAIAAAAEKREGFALLLASPDFNRR
ncbi:DUF1800 domain-containing protein [Albimonas pacifica]|uniref:Uncharacterized conserved protein, DUF1800 family n=1 Tax=Albimonas pacifica TaxID=1114924 RepID=A0A1I3GRV0_9RHOB|nr:DUF1800 domain-containing protein [Albimonas pacifica]SFI26275.1 Uncharacterized conserved protein, DUF1800 family [Albimonas pacifica]